MTFMEFTMQFMIEIKKMGLYELLMKFIIGTQI